MPSANVPWTDDELHGSVQVYVLLLRLQLQGGDERFEPIAQALLSGSLAQRNDAAIRYRLRNISAVVQELGAPILRDFSPAESVGRLVRPRIRAMLLQNADFSRILWPGVASLDDDRKNALRALQVLREQIEDLERELAWRGHNGPPDQEETGPNRSELRETIADIDLVKRQLESPLVDPNVVAGARARILDMGMKLGRWLGERATKFVDVALKTAAPLVVAKVTGLLPAIVNAVEALGKAVAH